MPKNKMREEMAESFIQALKEDRIPWEQGWTGKRFPVNAVSGSTYRGINKLWLSYTAGEKGYTDPRWCTFKQASAQGWKIRKGEKGTHVEFWSLYDTETKKKLSQQEAGELSQYLDQEAYLKRVKPIASSYVVFNAEQVEGIPERTVAREAFRAEELISQRDVLLKNMGVNFQEGGDKAAYRPGEDLIMMPVVEDFRDAYSYMSTMLHEAGHATGHQTRFNRNLQNRFGTSAYAQEELRAEISSAFTTQALMLDNDTSAREHMINHKAYIQSWIEVLENNPDELFAAARDAEKISDYLIEKGEFDLERVSEIRAEREFSTEQSEKTKPEKMELTQPSAEENLYSVSLYTDQEAASIRLAVKGREESIEIWRDDIGYKVALTASEYLDQGIKIQDVIANHVQDIDKQCLIGDPDYTRNILSSVYAHNEMEYRNLNGILPAGQPEEHMELVKNNIFSPAEKKDLKMQQNIFGHRASGAVERQQKMKLQPYLGR